jgi:hypothetical protein
MSERYGIKVVRLIVEHNCLSFPHGGTDFDKPGCPASRDVSSILARRYDDGDFDTIPWPIPKRSRAKHLKNLARALFDERRSNPFFPVSAVLELPDGTPFDAHAVLEQEVDEASKLAPDNGPDSR